MAIDTAAKRRRAAGCNFLPIPDGTVEAVDRAHVGGFYYAGASAAFEIVSIDPESGEQGNTISLIVTGAEDSQGNGAILIGGKSIDITSWSNILIIGTVPYGLAATAHTIVGINNSLETDTYDSFTVTVPSPGLDRVGIATMIRNCLRADTTTLYGSGKLVQVISSDLTEFNNASADTIKPYKLYLSCPSKSPSEVRAQNGDDEYEVQMRIEGYKIDPDTAASTIDDIDAQVELLINEQMYGGQMFTSYFTDSNAQVIDAEYITGDLPVEPQGDKIVVECAATIIVKINRWR